MRETDNIAAEVVEMQRWRGMEIFVFHDDTSFLPGHGRDPFIALADALERRGIGPYATVVKARPTVVEREVFEVRVRRLHCIRCLYLGSPSGRDTTASTTLTGDDNFGWAVSGAGDVNGDGYDDVVVGANAASTAYVYLGDANVDEDGDGVTVGAGDCDDTDADEDGYTDPSVTGVSRETPDGHAAPTEDDCDDTDGAIHPDASDVPDDGIDQDCDGADAEEAQDTETHNVEGKGGGCGCQTTGDGAPAAALALGLLLALRRRRATRLPCA